MNKKVFLFLSVFIFSFSFLDAQEIKNKFFLSDSMLKNLSWFNNKYLEIAGNWKCYKGNPNEATGKWTQSDFDDNNWEDVKTTLPVDSLPKSGWEGIGCFRLYLLIDSTLLNKPLALNIIHMGASEVYIDGKLFACFGKVGTSAHDEEGFNASTIIPHLVVFDKPHHIIALRYSGFNILQNRPPTIHNLGFKLLIGRAEDVNNSVMSHGVFFRPVEALVISIPLTFALIHFILFLFYRREKNNLYFALFAVTFALWGLLEHEGVSTTDAELSLFLKRLWLPYFALMPVIGLRFLYSLFYKEIPRQFWLFSIGAAAISVWAWFDLIPILSILMFMLTLAEMTRVVIIAIQKKIPGSWIIGAGFIAFSISLILLIIFSAIHNFSLFLWYILIYLTGVLPVLLSMSVYLSQKVASTNKNLETEMEKSVELQMENIRKETELKKAAELKEAYQALEKAHTNLKTTQALLIQSEKMASLGELTAGIAHEIQNPLNFVNNFSELSVDLAKELKEEAEKSEIDKELIIELATDLTQNQEKINHHGKRASSIVKGMLEHSRKSSGTKEPTDINALADEYLRLAYHGLRAKDKDFNAMMETNFDLNLPKIDVIPQDIGRVLLNLITNAFYAVNKRSKKDETGYEPKVTVTTQLTINSQVLIAIKDNGSGIPEAIKDKIFQPFFTTKPTGQGTGLGLSLSYDIVKAHGGELKVESIENIVTTFYLILPI